MKVNLIITTALLMFILNTDIYIQNQTGYYYTIDTMVKKELNFNKRQTVKY